MLATADNVVGSEAKADDFTGTLFTAVVVQFTTAYSLGYRYVRPRFRPAILYAMDLALTFCEESGIYTGRQSCFHPSIRYHVRNYYVNSSRSLLAFPILTQHNGNEVGSAHYVFLFAALGYAYAPRKCTENWEIELT